MSATSIRMGSYDLAVGNLLGSNCFNMAMLLPLDLLHAGERATGRERDRRKSSRSIHDGLGGDVTLSDR